MKKVISILTALVLSLQLTTAFAEYETPTIVVGEYEGKPGDTVTVKVNLNQEDDEVEWSNLAFTVAYDATALELTEAKIRAAGGTGVVPSADQGTLAQNPMLVNIISADVNDFTGEVLRLKFKILETAKGGEYPITVDWYKGPNGDFENGVDVNFKLDSSNNKTPFIQNYESGSITVDAPVGPTEPTLGASRTSTGVAITAESPEAITGKFIVAGYNADGLTAVEVIDAAATATSTVTGDTIKVMWWDSLTGLNSIDDAIVL